MAAPIMLSLCSKSRTFILFLSLTIRVTHSFINIEELKSSVYDIDIWDKPLLYDDSKTEDGVILSSKLGQQYQCLYNDASALPEDKEAATAKRNVSTLLKPIEDGNCLKNTFGWWTYEFCYKRDIKQYHMENGELVDSSVSILGEYASDFDWNTENMKTSDELLGQYHSQSYVNGTLCDLTGRPRLTTVRFRCNFERGDVDQIVSLDEPATCEYILTISTSRICQLEYIKILPARKSIPITCQPLLVASEFEEYTLEQKIKEEFLKTGEKSASGTSADSTLPNWEKWLTKMKSSSLIIVGMSGGAGIDNIVTSLQDVLGEGSETIPPTASDSVEVQIVNSVADLAQVLEEFEKDVEMGLEETQRALDAQSEILDATSQAVDALALSSPTTTATTEPVEEESTSVSNDDPNFVNSNDDAVIPDLVEMNIDALRNSEEVVHDNARTDDDVSPIERTLQTSDEFIPSSDDTLVESSSTSSDVDASDISPDSNNIPPVKQPSQTQEVSPSSDQVLVASSPIHADDNNNNNAADDIPENDDSTLPVDTPPDSSSPEVVEPSETHEVSSTEAIDNSEMSPLLKQISLLKAKVLEIRAREQAAQDASGMPSRKLEVKVINADYYNEKGNPVSRRPERKVMAIFQNNDNEIQAYAKNRQLENSYNFKWTRAKDSKNRKKT